VLGSGLIDQSQKMTVLRLRRTQSGLGLEPGLSS
jgi:hypothetical protein